MKAEKIAETVSDASIRAIERLFDAPLDVGVADNLRKNIQGLLRGMYVHESGVITHDGIRETLRNNGIAKRRSQKRNEVFRKQYDIDPLQAPKNPCTKGKY